MNIAFLVLAHKNPGQLEYLAEALTEDGDDVYIHIDKKADFAFKETENVFVIPKEKSYSISWGSIEMVYATLRLLEEANKKDYDYICLLSGQDLPLYSIRKIKEFLDADGKSNYIDVAVQNDMQRRKSLKLVETDYPEWISLDRISVKIIKNIYMLISGGTGHTFSFLKKKPPLDFKIYFGSQWWMLNSETAIYVEKICKENPQILRYFEKTIVPDESFFQTIVMNSEYSKSVKESLMFVNWMNNKRSPEVICDRIIVEAARKQGKVFARKFDFENQNSLKRILTE